MPSTCLLLPPASPAHRHALPHTFLFSPHASTDRERNLGNQQEDRWKEEEEVTKEEAAPSNTLPPAPRPPLTFPLGGEVP